MDHLKGPVAGPRGSGGGAHIRVKHHVAFDEAIFACGLAPTAGDGLVKDTVGKMEIPCAAEFLGWNSLAAGDAREV